MEENILRFLKDNLYLCQLISVFQSVRDRHVSNPSVIPSSAIPSIKAGDVAVACVAHNVI